MKELKVVFMGTPEFSVPVLEGLIENCNVVGVVCQPDKKVGRKQILTKPPVKDFALANNIPVLQPIKIKDDYQQIIDLEPDIIITCAYGQIIPKVLLDYPKYGCINVHASLLPKLRGGAPIHKALIEGYSKTGITIMYMDVGMDTGDIISISETKIEDSDNLETLSNRLSFIGKDLLLKTLPDIITGNIKRTKQEEKEVTYAYNIKREEEHIDFNKTSREVFNQIRGLSPDIGAYALLDSKEIKFFDSKILDNKKHDEVGKITGFTKEGIIVSTIDGQVVLTSLQVPGKKRMLARDYLNGIDKKSLLDKVLK